MKKSFVVGLAVIAAALMPAAAIGLVPEGEIDIAGAEMAGSDAINVFGTLRCAAAGPLNLDVILNQGSTGGVGGGASNSYTCLAPGDQVKWVITATGGGPWMVGDKITITAFAFGSMEATDTEEHVLRWGR